MKALRIPNRDARRLWLWTNGLGEAPTGPLDVMAIIRSLGFVQIDTIRNVTRAHNHILWSRDQRFREGMLWPLLRERALFEHFTHDASLIPAETLPFWQRRFRELGQRVARHGWYQSGLGQGEIARIRARIAAEGPLSTHAFDTKIGGAREMWARPPHKKALEQMWYAGVLATAHRENFVKYYDLGERVFPVFDAYPAEVEQAGWLCAGGLDRLAVASPGEIQRFWGAVTAAEARNWTATAGLAAVEIEAADGNWSAAFAPQDIEARLATVFDYRNEMFVPKENRRWGYYVYPLLEGTRFVGRIELRADREGDALAVTGFWPEPGVRWGVGRMDRLTAELLRFARLGRVRGLRWQVPRPG
jgi:uncharacterized protein YcaQ